jgi:hypothetical protein
MEKKEEIDYNNVEAKFYFGDVCPPIPAVMFFLDKNKNKEKEKEKKNDHSS